MIVIQGYIRTAPENAAKFREAASPLIAETRKEVGCIEYAFAEDIGDPGLFHVVERWADDASNAAHGKTPHFAAFSAALPTLGVGLTLKVHDGDMRSAGYALVATLSQVIAHLDPAGDWPMDALAPWLAPMIRNTRGVVTGAYQARGALHFS